MLETLPNLLIDTLVVKDKFANLWADGEEDLHDEEPTYVFLQGGVEGY